ncbi:hypothetical protein CDL12_05533 [Handroanthus impetiginosus]|uniref:Uncharacterized protein n=1 Tax=Handroanthus impetiginosus TaxID=429701 RepID=A0A2G9HWB7_9LAMI|nr:hypothetical protein CDL12_05533 [Handroanthus impetiginosus]
MAKIYDDWQRLVEAVMRREQLRQMAAEHEQTDSSSSSSSDNEETTSTSGSTRFSLDEAAGKKIYIVRAKQLLILMRRDSYWEWTTHDDSRFSEVAVLHYGRCLDIRARIQTQELSESSVYSAYLVFKLTRWSKGLESAKAVVNIFSEESDRHAEERAHVVHLQQGKDIQRGQFAVRRMDGWMEVEIGNFYIDGHDEAVEARILERTSWKMGLIVEGVEFRPLYGGTRIVCQQRFQLPITNLIALRDNDHEGTSRSSDLVAISDNGDADTDNPGGHAVAVMEEIKETKIEEIDVSLLQEFVPLPSLPGPEPITPSVLSHSQSKQKKLKTITVENGLGSHSDDIICSEAGKFCPDWNLRNGSSLQDDGIGVEMMSKSLLPKDEPSLASLSRDQLFSKGYDCLSEVVYYFHGMKNTIEHKERESDDLKQKLLKYEVEAQLALAAKDSELDELKKMVKLLQNDIEKAQNYAQEEVRKAAYKIKEVEENLEKVEARAAKAVENYKNSEELKVDKHKFASKAFAIGFEFCKKQVLEMEPGLDISGLDVKRLEASSSLSSTRTQ